MIVLTRDVLNRLMMWHLVAGALVGVLILQPVNDLIYWFQYDPDAATAGGYVWHQLWASLVGAEWRKGLFYAGVGALVGALTAAVSRRVLTQQRRMVQLTMELERDLIALIAKGESRRGESSRRFAGTSRLTRSTRRWNTPYSRAWRRFSTPMVARCSSACRTMEPSSAWRETIKLSRRKIATGLSRPS